MKDLIGLLLCAIGLHDWEDVQNKRIRWTGFDVFDWADKKVCLRCHKCHDGITKWDQKQAVEEARYEARSLKKFRRMQRAKAMWANCKGDQD